MMLRDRFLVAMLCLMTLALVGCPPKDQVTVPSLGGMTQGGAETALALVGLTSGNVTQASNATVPAGQIISQNPAAGAKVSPNSSVSFVISSGPTQATVPSLSGMTQAQAEAAIEAAGLDVGTVSMAASNTVTFGQVASQTPAAGTHVAQGSSVSFKVSSSPVVNWSTTTPDIPNTVMGLSLDVTTDNGFVVGGGDGSKPYQAKLASGGSVEWDATYSRMTETATPAEMWSRKSCGAGATSDGGSVIALCGHLWQDGLPETSYTLLKTDAIGEEDWSDSYAPVNPYGTNGVKCINNYPAAVQQTADGGYVMFGNSYVGMYGLASIVKTDADGAEVFCKVINDNARAYDQTATNGLQTADGGYLWCGYSSNSNPGRGYMALLIKLNGSGVWQWSKTYQYPAGGTQGWGALANAVAPTAAGGFLVVGQCVNDIPAAKSLGHGLWMAKVEGDGDVIWSRQYDSQQTLPYAFAVAELPDGNFIAGSAMAGKPAISKFNANGDLMWNLKMDTLPSYVVKDIVVLDGGSVALVAGTINGPGTLVAKVNYVYPVD